MSSVILLACLSLTYIIPSEVEATCQCRYYSGCSRSTAPGTCQQRVDYYESTILYYSYTTSCGWFGWARCTHTSERYVAQRKFYCIPYCCPGYYLRGSICYPQCYQNCINGHCSAPQTCTCNSGWTGVSCEAPVCTPECVNGRCTSPGVCTCNPGWEGSRCTRAVCTPECENGMCTSPNVCTCDTGWEGGRCTKAICTSACQNGGTCSSPDVCTCDTARWKGSTCRIPVCSPECQNGECTSPGVCTCHTGWLGSSCNTDVDECATNNAGCEHDCYNSPGSYSCNCNEGYEVHEDQHQCLPICTGGCRNGGTCTAPETCSCIPGWTGQYCENDVEECSLGISGCQQVCINHPGGYSCNCNSGYILDSDHHGCSDINECNTNNGYCDHLCTNTEGSYFCTCKQGYTLQEGGLTCVAQPCPHLNAPLNGNISCTGEQVTDESCFLSCYPGFRMEGSSDRTCQPNNTWTGLPTSCSLLHCSALEPTDDSFIVYPCNTAYQSTCTIACLPGYYIQELGLKSMSCVLGSTPHSVIWTERPMCLEIQPCSPNPCCHNGVCTENDRTYTCDCEGTGYEGDVCQIGVVQVSYISILEISEVYQLFINANPDTNLIIELSTTAHGIVSLTPDTIQFDPSTPNQTVSISSTHAVVAKLQFSLSGPDSRQFATPKSRSIVVRNPDSMSTYAKDRMKPVGILEPSCCTDMSFQYSCPSDNTAVFFNSSCSYSTSTSPFVIPGISFVIGQDVSLPLSMYSCKLSSSLEVELNLNSTMQCNSCSQVSSTATCSSATSSEAGCYCYQLSQSDTQAMLESEALANTYLEQIRYILPEWLTLRVVPSNRTHFEDSYHTYLVNYDALDTVASCPNFIQSVATPGLYSVLKYNGKMTVSVGDDMESYSPLQGGDSPFCIAIDNCKGVDSNIHTSLPQNHPFNAFLKSWKDHGWTINLEGLSVLSSSYAMDTTSNSFWNGTHPVDVSLSRPDIAVKGQFGGQWNINKLCNVTMDGIGEILVDTAENTQTQLPHVTKVTYLGDTLFGILFNSAHLTFSHPSGNGAFYFTERTEPCTNARIGMMRLHYSQLPDKRTFFSRFLPISSTQGTSCPVDVALRLNSFAEVVGLAIRSTCQELVLGKLFFAGVQHVISVGGEESPAACGNVIPLAASSEDVIVYTTVESGMTRLNSYLSLDIPDTNGPHITTIINPSTEAFTATVNHMLISIFRTSIQSTVTITEHKFEFRASLNIFDSYSATIIGTSPTTQPWEDMDLRIEGWIGRDLINVLNEYVRLSLMEETASSVSRIQNANMSLTRILRQKVAMQEVFQNDQSNAQLLQDQCTTIETDINILNGSIAALELQVSTSLQRNLDSVCTVHSCQQVYVPISNCAWCDVPMSLSVPSKCSASCSSDVTVQIQDSTTTMTKLREVNNCSSSSFCISCQANKNKPNAFSAVSCTGGLFPGRCSTYLVTDQVSVPRFVTTTKQVSYNCFTDCNTSILFNFTQECCQESNESYSFLQPQCLVDNIACKVVQEGILDHISTDTSLAAEVNQLRELLNLRANLTTMEAQLAACKLKSEVAQTKYNLTSRLYKEVVLASEDAGEEFTQIRLLHEVGSQLHEELQTHPWESIFDISNITFNVSGPSLFTSTLPLNIKYSRLLLNQSDVMTSSMFDFLYTNQSIHVLSMHLKNRILNEYSNRQGRAAKSQSLGIDWSLLCQNLYSINSVVEVLLSSLMTTANTSASLHEQAATLRESIRDISAEVSSSSGNVVSGINQTALNSLAPDLSLENLEAKVSNGRELNAIRVELMNIVNISDPLFSSLAQENFAFQEWQLQMENQIHLTMLDFGHVCVGFLDCLHTIIETVQDVLRTPQQPTTEKLLEMLPRFVDQLLELALYDNIILQEAITRVTNFRSILDDVAEFGYWCAAPPLASFSDYDDIIIMAGDPLNLMCEVDSQWSVNYEWVKDNETVASTSTDTFHIESAEPSDSGMYHCVASNHIGSHATSFVKVTVATPPVIVEHGDESMVVSTYTESCSPLVLACDASGNPDPDIGWYFKQNEDDQFEQLPGQSATELQYVFPRPHHTGQYYCMASNIQDSVRSIFTDVRILKSSVTQFVLPVMIEFTKEVSSRRKRVAGFSYVDTGINPLQYVTLDEDENELTAKVQEVIQTERNIPVIKASFDNPSSPSSLTFLVGTRLIPIDENHTTPVLDLFQNNTDAKVDLEDFVEELNALLPYLNYSTLVESYHTVSGGVDASTGIYRCPQGQGLNTSNYMFCVACAPGQYQSSKTEILCGPVLYAYHTCLPCSVGQYQPNEGQVECIQCEAGTYQSSIGSHTCKLCSRGHYQPEKGQTGCIPCEPGSYQNDTGGTTCIPCSLGRYQSDSGQPSCTECPNGSTTSNMNSIQCIEEHLNQEAVSDVRLLWVIPVSVGVFIIAIIIGLVILLLCIVRVCKRKRKIMPQNKAVDNRHELYLVPNPDPFAQNSGPDVEHNDTVEALYDTINDHNFPFISRVKKSYTVTRPSNPVQESTLDKTEEEYMSPEYNIPKVAEQGSSDQPRLSSALTQGTVSDQKATHTASRYKELDHRTLATPNVYQSNKEVDSDYDVPLVLALLPEVEESDSEVYGMPKGEAIKEDIGTQKLISDIDDVATQNEGVDSEQMVATDEEYVDMQNSIADDEEEEIDNQFITLDTVNLL